MTAVPCLRAPSMDDASGLVQACAQLGDGCADPCACFDLGAQELVDDLVRSAVAHARLEDCRVGIGDRVAGVRIHDHQLFFDSEGQVHGGELAVMSPRSGGRGCSGSEWQMESAPLLSKVRPRAAHLHAIACPATAGPRGWLHYLHIVALGWPDRSLPLIHDTPRRHLGARTPAPLGHERDRDSSTCCRSSRRRCRSESNRPRRRRARWR